VNKSLYSDGSGSVPIDGGSGYGGGVYGLIVIGIPIAA
jgi:hypothetical protein